jgi:hypothetical protein
MTLTNATDRAKLNGGPPGRPGRLDGKPPAGGAISSVTIERLRANAAESRAAIAAGPAYCRRCGTIHPATFVFRGVTRGWHALGDAQSTPARLVARRRWL